MSALSFSPITEENHDAAFRLQCQCHSYPWSRATFVSCLDEQYFAYQVHSNQTLGGYYVGLNVAGEGTLMDIGVSASLRGNGIGKALLSHFIEQCQKHGMQMVWLEVRASNAAAIHLYCNRGFELIETRKNYYPLAEGREDAQIMRLNLS